MATSVKEIIRRRKSVRTYNGEPLRSDDRQKPDEFLKTLDNLFDVSVEFRFLDAKEHGISGPVIVGADAYIAAEVARVSQSEIDYGYSFECLQSHLVSVLLCWRGRSATAHLRNQ